MNKHGKGLEQREVDVKSFLFNKRQGNIVRFIEKTSSILLCPPLVHAQEQACGHLYT